MSAFNLVSCWCCISSSSSLLSTVRLMHRMMWTPRTYTCCQLWGSTICKCSTTHCEMPLCVPGIQVFQVRGVPGPRKTTKLQRTFLGTSSILGEVFIKALLHKQILEEREIFLSAFNLWHIFQKAPCTEFVLYMYYRKDKVIHSSCLPKWLCPAPDSSLRGLILV